MCFNEADCLMRQYDEANVQKDSIKTVGGEIINSYCTCTAGVFGSCNHVAGLLFHFEAAVLLGHTHQTCTSQLSQWNISSHKKQTEPGEVTTYFGKRNVYEEWNSADSKWEKATSKVENEFPGGIKLSS